MYLIPSERKTDYRLFWVERIQSYKRGGRKARFHTVIHQNNFLQPVIPHQEGYCHIIMGYINIGMCHCEGYGFQAVYSGIGYINQRVRVYNKVSFPRKLISWLKILVQTRETGNFLSTI